ncbi:hypothetical protein Godav_023142, partial [Gossypium davidsonii]|nr:hypothetical protein [Gossypium davidsonii]
LEDTFPVPRDDSTKVQRVQYAWVYILQIFGGYLMPDKSRNLVHLRWNHSPSYGGIPTALEDIRLLLDQQSEAHQAIFPLRRGELLANPCRKGMTGPFKSKKNRWKGGPINSAHAITSFNGASDDAHTIAPLDFTRCVS